MDFPRVFEFKTCVLDFFSKYFYIHNFKFFFTSFQNN